MRPIPYPRGFRLNPRIREALDNRLIRRLPYQDDRSDLLTTDGVDITYDLRNMTPSRFIRGISELLILAEYEANRYSDVEFRYARFMVELNTGGRRGSEKIRRAYTTALMRDTDEMVYGSSDEEPVELGGTGKSLSHKAEAIINMLDTGSPGAYVNRQNPYRVLRMIISVRDQIKSPVGAGSDERGTDSSSIRRGQG